MQMQQNVEWVSVSKHRLLVAAAAAAVSWCSVGDKVERSTAQAAASALLLQQGGRKKQHVQLAAILL